MNDNNKYNIITLCGSIKFKDEFLKLQEKLTLDGNIVLTPNFFNNVKKEEINLETKKMLDEMHKQKIDMSDEIYVINFGGYIGESTKSEIEYAKTKDKKIAYIEDIKEIAIMEEKKEDTNCCHGFNNTLADAIEKIKSEKWKSIFIERLNDKTLSQIGNEMNLSRERINKIVDKILSEINIINEDKEHTRCHRRNDVHRLAVLRRYENQHKLRTDQHQRHGYADHYNTKKLQHLPH